MAVRETCPQFSVQTRCHKLSRTACSRGFFGQRRIADVKLLLVCAACTGSLILMMIFS